MAKKPRTPKVISNFALIDIEGGREELAKLVSDNHRVRFVISGYINSGAGGVGHDDGVSREFSSTVEKIDLFPPEFVPSDKVGRPWAILSDLKAGDSLELDGDFTCFKDPKRGRRIVKLKRYAKTKGLYFDCDDGKHFLVGQLGNHGELIGCYALK